MFNTLHSFSLFTVGRLENPDSQNLVKLISMPWVLLVIKFYFFESLHGEKIFLNFVVAPRIQKLKISFDSY